MTRIDPRGSAPRCAFTDEFGDDDAAVFCQEAAEVLLRVVWENGAAVTYPYCRSHGEGMERTFREKGRPVSVTPIKPWKGEAE